jgi:glutathione S-transferase
MFGLCSKLCSENGYAWNLRLISCHEALIDPETSEDHRGFVRRIALKYGYDPERVAAARAQIIRVIAHLRGMLTARPGARYLIGDQLSALDICWATMAGGIAPLPVESCPNMPASMRRSYMHPQLAEIAGTALLAHRDFIYRTYLKLPMDF